MMHRKGLVSGIWLCWTLVPLIGSYGLGSGNIIDAAREREIEERERKRDHIEVGEKNDGYVLYGVLILF